MTYASARLWSPVRRANFEHFELGRGSINFKVFKVASAGQGRHTNFENFEVGGGTASLKVFKVERVNPKRRFEEFSKVAAGPPVTDWHGPHCDT